MTNQVAENITVHGSLVYNNQLCSRAPPQTYNQVFPDHKLLSSRYSNLGWIELNQLQHDTVSHLVLHVYLGPTGEKQLYHISMTTVTGKHEGSPAILRRQMRQRYHHSNVRMWE